MKYVRHHQWTCGNIYEVPRLLASYVRKSHKFRFLTLETGMSANFDVRRNVVPPWRVRQAHSGSNSPMTSQNVNAKQSRKVASSGRFRHILHIFGQE